MLKRSYDSTILDNILELGQNKIEPIEIMSADQSLNEFIKFKRTNQSAILDAILKTSNDELQLEVPFNYKDNAFYLGKTKIADVKKDKNGNPDIVFTHTDYTNLGGKLIVDFFYESLKDNSLEEKEYEIEMPVNIEAIETASDSEMDSRGDEYSFLYAKKIKVTCLHEHVTNLLSEKSLIAAQEHVDNELNKDYKPKYVGTHRTHP